MRFGFYLAFLFLLLLQSAAQDIEETDGLLSIKDVSESAALRRRRTREQQRKVNPDLFDLGSDEDDADHGSRLNGDDTQYANFDEYLKDSAKKGTGNDAELPSISLFTTEFLKKIDQVKRKLASDAQRKKEEEEAQKQEKPTSDDGTSKKPAKQQVIIPKWPVRKYSAKAPLLERVEAFASDVVAWEGWLYNIMELRKTNSASATSTPDSLLYEFYEKYAITEPETAMAAVGVLPEEALDALKEAVTGTMKLTKTLRNEIMEANNPAPVQEGAEKTTKRGKKAEKISDAEASKAISLLDGTENIRQTLKETEWLQREQMNPALLRSTLAAFKICAARLENSHKLLEEILSSLRGGPEGSDTGVRSKEVKNQMKEVKTALKTLKTEMEQLDSAKLAIKRRLNHQSPIGLQQLKYAHLVNKLVRDPEYDGASSSTVKDAVAKILGFTMHELFVFLICLCLPFQACQICAQVCKLIYRFRRIWMPKRLLKYFPLATPSQSASSASAATAAGREEKKRQLANEQAAKPLPTSFYVDIVIGTAAVLAFPYLAPAWFSLPMLPFVTPRSVLFVLETYATWSQMCTVGVLGLLLHFFQLMFLRLRYKS